MSRQNKTPLNILFISVPLLDGITVEWRYKGACLPSFISRWGCYVDIWVLYTGCGITPQSSFFSSSLGFPSPKPMPNRPLRHSRAARSNLTLTTASPQTSSLSIPHTPAPIPHWSWSPNLHHNKDRREGGWGGEGVRGLRSVRKNGRGLSSGRVMIS